MVEHNITPEVTISKTQHRLKVGYVRARHDERKTGMTTYYSQHPILHLKENWLKEAGFETGYPVTVKIEAGCLILTTEQTTDD